MVIKHLLCQMYYISIMCIITSPISLLSLSMLFTLNSVFTVIISNVNPPCLATGDWRAQCLSCGGGYLPGVLRLGTAHHSHAYGKPVLLHLPHSQFQIRENYEPWMFAFILPSFCIHNKVWHFPLPGSKEPCMNFWINESWSNGEGRMMQF